MASAERSDSRSNVDEEKADTISAGEKSGDSVEIVFLNYYERCAGRLVLDPKSVSFFLRSPCLVFADRPSTREASTEFGEEVSSHLKLSPDGTTVLWPQPSDDPDDPQNVRPCLKAVIDNVSLSSYSAVVRKA
jgi:hypothetical protein